MEQLNNIPQRASGVLLPVSSLPGPHGIGTFGRDARGWIDFLARAGQQYWQVLPLGPTSYGDSPYQSFSAFAGNAYFIDLDTLCEQGLLRREEYASIQWARSPRAVDYGTLYRHREAVLRRAFGRFSGWAALEAFVAENAHWIESYALFMAVKATQGERSWTEWDEALRLRRPGALAAARRDLAEDIRYHCFTQYLFFSQWHALRRYAASKQVQIIGDIPIYVAMDSADVWEHARLFQLDADARPIEVSGCPPDGFSCDGQLWGNPLYDWEAMRADGYRWWIERTRAAFKLYDVLRIDHFRGLESYYAIPAANTTARQGRWCKGPGMSLLRAIGAEVPRARIIAEDLGFLTKEVQLLLEESGLPGMKVLQFAFDCRETSSYSPYTYGPNNVVFTGTHDNDTIRGWAKSAPRESVAHAMEYLGVHSVRRLPRAMIRLAMQSPANLAVIPIQDWLGRGSEARINIPATLGGNNWRWRMTRQEAREDLAQVMAQMTALYGRAPRAGPDEADGDNHADSRG